MEVAFSFHRFPNRKLFIIFTYFYNVQFLNQTPCDRLLFGIILQLYQSSQINLQSREYEFSNYPLLLAQETGITHAREDSSNRVAWNYLCTSCGSGTSLTA